MAGVAVIGERALVRGWALAGASVLGVDSAEEARQAWSVLGADVAVVVLSSLAAWYLAGELAGCRWPLVVVIPP